MNNVDAVLAYKSDSKFNLMEKYLSKYPKLIRPNTNSIAIINGHENNEELSLLGKDIFNFFGLSNRNVSKLFVPENYNFTPLFEALNLYEDLINHPQKTLNKIFNQ